MIASQWEAGKYIEFQYYDPFKYDKLIWQAGNLTLFRKVSTDYEEQSQFGTGALPDLWLELSI